MLPRCEKICDQIREPIEKVLEKCPLNAVIDKCPIKCKLGKRCSAKKEKSHLEANLTVANPTFEKEKEVFDASSVAKLVV
uniref:TRAF-type domain-containing protein n=1 Tax=Steinernema glaseri TaxID=37863 RepID=A0A1I8A8D2_9BILA